MPGRGAPCRGAGSCSLSARTPRCLAGRALNGVERRLGQRKGGQGSGLSSVGPGASLPLGALASWSVQEEAEPEQLLPAAVSKSDFILCLGRFFPRLGGTASCAEAGRGLVSKRRSPCLPRVRCRQMFLIQTERLRILIKKRTRVEGDLRSYETPRDPRFSRTCK